MRSQLPQHSVILFLFVVSFIVCCYAGGGSYRPAEAAMSSVPKGNPYYPQKEMVGFKTGKPEAAIGLLTALISHFLTVIDALSGSMTASL